MLLPSTPRYRYNYYFISIIVWLHERYSRQIPVDPRDIILSIAFFGDDIKNMS